MLMVFVKTALAMLGGFLGVFAVSPAEMWFEAAGTRITGFEMTM